METAFQEGRTALSELEEPRWAVVSFDGLAAAGLTYEQAVKVMADLDTDKIAGLCIVTDEASRNLKS